MNYTSESKFRVVFNKGLVTTLYHDLCNQLSQTDFEQRFYHVHAQRLMELQETLKNTLEIKNVFDFSVLDTNVVSEILETLFYFAASTYKTFSMNGYKKDELYKELEEYEEQIARFELFGSRVEAKNSFSEGFVKEQIKQLINAVYTDLFFTNSKVISNKLSSEDKIERYTEFYYNQIRDKIMFEQMGLPANFDEKHFKDYLEQQVRSDYESFCKIDSIKTLVEYLNQLNERYTLETGKGTSALHHNQDSEQIIVNLYLYLSRETNGLNVSDALREYFVVNDTEFNQIFSMFLSSFTKKDYKIEWFVPCFPGFHDKELWSEVNGLKILKNSEVENYFYDNEHLVADIKKNHPQQLWVKFLKLNSPRDIQFAYFQLEQQWNSYLDIIHFADQYRVPNKFTEYEGLYDVEDMTSGTIHYGKNGFEATFQPPLNERAVEIKKETYKNLVYNLETIPDDHNLKKRLILSLRYYRDHLEASFYGDKLLKLWHCLEVLSQQDNVDTIKEMLAIFPAIRTTRLFPNERIMKMNADERSAFFRNQKQYFDAIIKNMGMIRNEYVAHVNRGETIQERRFERHVEQLRQIVIGIQYLTITLIKQDPEYDKMKKIQKKLEEDFLS
ncbi:hypothetical protein ACFQ3N_13125 [Virgibacillus byunsanensis]|uniref:ApeA N-terminal domain-containing protein n=1 Tax=Virgibacillus byunsanensis TaxID=570945 RepID=A0ABW3LND4_9BACI